MKIPSVLNKFQTLLSNEEYTHELLPYNFSIVFFFHELVHYKFYLLSKKNIFSPYFDYFDQLKKMELDRIIYLLKNYHKIRISKIEKNFVFKHNGKKFFNLMSLPEKIYTRAYNFFFLKNIESFFSHFDSPKIKNKFRFTKRIFNENGIETKDFYVFFQILNKKIFQKKKKNLFYSLSVSYKTEIYCMKFSSVRRLVFSGIIFLV
ncbi:hypothetical protein CMESO_543 (nucleomorph) [Chroomonas mesostigmatica CCMP1168]|uniref:DNA replication complex GINS protein SLD5 n=1 Tax=Chroomonas mesostigmatica CCMP1168 TaxID=1195612 RepID=J7G3P0_9CRYP|nr:hypothetical protein CMESO_543 [Chroomonas mesostigmatica CCMP1168]